MSMSDPRPTEGGPANTPPFAPSPEYDAQPGPSVPLDAHLRGGVSDDDGRVADLDDSEPLAPRTRPVSHHPAHGRLGTRATADLRRRAERGLTRSLERFADRLEEAAEQIEELRVSHLQPASEGHRVSDVAHSTAGWMGEAADYLRSQELPELRADLERQIRERPLQALLLAAGTGWLIGKILR